MKTTTLAITLSTLTVGSAIAAQGLPTQNTQHTHLNTHLTKTVVTDLGSGTLNPNSKATISLDSLHPEIRYDLSCSLEANGAAAMVFKPDVNIYRFSIDGYTLNGEPFDGQGSVKKGTNTFVASKLEMKRQDGSSAAFALFNFDDTTIVNYHCQAQVSSD